MCWIKKQNPKPSPPNRKGHFLFLVSFANVKWMWNVLTNTMLTCQVFNEELNFFMYTVNTHALCYSFITFYSQKYKVECQVHHFIQNCTDFSKLSQTTEISFRVKKRKMKHLWYVKQALVINWGYFTKKNQIVHK